MTDHHDFGDHHDFDDYSQPDFHHDDQPPFDDGAPDHFDHFDDVGHHVETPPVEEHHLPTTEDVHVFEEHHDTTAVDDNTPEPADVFPPPVDVGELPEPVDGFPWTDAATLGTPDLAAHDALQTVDPHELAEYAGTEIPPGADPWAVLADSDDPATSTLARFWHDTSE
jgi:hypothetical protein